MKETEEQENRMSDTSIPYPWVEYDTLGDAIDTIGSNETEVHIYNQQNVTDDLTIPANVTLKFTQGGTLNISDTKTVTINGHVEAGLYHIFEGAGSVSFGAGSVKEVYPEWWGAIADNSTDNVTALTSAWGTGLPIHLTSGVYRFSSALTATSDNFSLFGSGKYKTTLYNTGTTGALKFQCNQIQISNLCVLGKANSGSGLIFDASSAGYMGKLISTVSYTHLRAHET